MPTNGFVIAGGAISKSTMDAIDAAAAKTPTQWRRFIAYDDDVHVGGSLAWRANNPGNLRDASSKIGRVPGASGFFAVFADLDAGRAAQQDLYVKRYGSLKVRDAIEKLTPRNENDTDVYLSRLQKAGVDLDQTVASQITVLMQGVQANEGLIAGFVVGRTP